MVRGRGRVRPFMKEIGLIVKRKIKRFFSWNLKIKIIQLFEWFNQVDIFFTKPQCTPPISLFIFGSKVRHIKLLSSYLYVLFQKS